MIAIVSLHDDNGSTLLEREIAVPEGSDTIQLFYIPKGQYLNVTRDSFTIKIPRKTVIKWQYLNIFIDQKTGNKFAEVSDWFTREEAKKLGFKASACIGATKREVEI